MVTVARIDPDRLLTFATAVYVAAGLREPDARLCADTLVQADLWGHQSHGVMRLSWYAARLKAGVCEPKAKPEFVVDAGGLALIDGHDGMGQMLTARAAQEAVRRAKTHALRRSACAIPITSAPPCTSRSWPHAKAAWP